ncbi:hypothetical protein GGX14DRAFT_458255 [Mycena pura]|uniref:NmrA-like domain-containing protein n=1 Tax=Mycena pura TaxID=153505 RepID=A0AAD6YET4_9AGAR|nr:hypothetical protein GGX14DRAFT_458255 [Mycena pura]
MKVALAGATTGVGHCIAEAILKHGKHTLIILSRHDISAFSGHVHIVESYTVDSLIPALSGVHTVISAIGDHSRSADAQVALAEAAVAANVVRFIPSGWSGADGGEDDVIELYRYQQRALAVLRKSKLQWSFPQCGIFLNYFATPQKDGLGPLKPLKFWIDVENCRATIPGDGNIELAYTAVEDVGEFIARALDVDGQWPNPLRIVGTTITHNKLVKIAEEVRGKPFTIAYKNREQLTNELVTDPPSIYVNLTTQLSLALLDKRFTFDSDPDFDGDGFQFTQPRVLMEKWWSTVQ